MIPSQKWSLRTIHSKIIGPPGPNIAAILGLTPPSAVDGPTLGVVFSECLADRWVRKDEAVYMQSVLAAVTQPYEISLLTQLHGPTHAYDFSRSSTCGSHLVSWLLRLYTSELLSKISHANHTELSFITYSTCHAWVRHARI